MHAVDLGELDARAEDHLFHLGLCQVATSVGTDIGQPIPFVHTKLADPDFNVQPVVVVLADIAFCQMLPQHLIMNILAALDLGDQTSSCFGKDAQGVSEKVLPPFVLPIVGAWRAPAGPYTDENPNFPPGPFIHGGFFQDLWGRVVRAGTFVDEEMLSDLDRFESQPGGRCGPTGLPDGAIELGWGFFSRVVGTKQYGRAVASGSFVEGRHGTANIVNPTQ